ncbi:hypothetical protein ABBQ38_015460 [Trebouxia sp. C0009 RCD-2024]
MLLPPLGVAALATFANHDMQKQEALLLIQKEQQEKEELAAQLTVPTQPQESSAHADSRTSPNSEVKAKLEALEDAIKLMQVRQLVQDMTGSTRFPSAGSLQDKPAPSFTASKTCRLEAKQAPQPDVASTSVEEQAHSLPQGPQKQSAKLVEAQQPAGAPADHAVSTEPPPAAQSRESVSIPASHPKAVDAIRYYAKSQVRWLLGSVSPLFSSSNKRDNASSQPEEQAKLNEPK